MYLIETRISDFEETRMKRIGITYKKSTYYFEETDTKVERVELYAKHNTFIICCVGTEELSTVINALASIALCLKNGFTDILEWNETPEIVFAENKALGIFKEDSDAGNKD